MPLTLLLASTLLTQRPQFSPEIERWAEWLRSHTAIASTRGWTNATWIVEPPNVVTAPGFLSPKRDRLLTLDGRMIPYRPYRPRGDESVFLIDLHPILPQSQLTVALLLAQGRWPEAIQLAAKLQSETRSDAVGKGPSEIRNAVLSHIEMRYLEVVTDFGNARDVEALKGARLLTVDLPTLTEVLESAVEHVSEDSLRASLLPDLPSVVTDLERRLHGGRKATHSLPRASVSELIRRLEDVSGSTGLGGRTPTFRYNSVVRELAARGNEAVAALLDVVERDERLTRTVKFHDFMALPTIVPVTSPALDALNVMVNVRELPGAPDRHDRKTLVRVYRAFFQATKGQSLAQRTLALLREENAISTWTEAATSLISPVPLKESSISDDERTGVLRLADALTGAERKEAVKLLERRFGELGRKLAKPSYIDGMASVALARALIQHEESDEYLKSTTDRSIAYLTGKNSRSDARGGVARVFRMRIRRGDTGAVSEYEAWLKRICERAESGWLSLQWLAPLRDLDNNLELVPIASWVLESTESPFRRERYRTLTDWEGPMLSLGPLPSLVRTAFLRELADQSPAGTVTRTSDTGLKVELSEIPGWSEGGGQRDLDLPIGKTQPLRRNDVLANLLGRYGKGEVRFSVGWSRKRRDAAIQKIVVQLRSGRSAED